MQLTSDCVTAWEKGEMMETSCLTVIILCDAEPEEVCAGRSRSDALPVDIIANWCQGNDLSIAMSDANFHHVDPLLQYALMLVWVCWGLPAPWGWMPWGFPMRVAAGPLPQPQLGAMGQQQHWTPLVDGPRPGLDTALGVGLAGQDHGWPGLWGDRAQSCHGLAGARVESPGDMVAWAWAEGWPRGTGNRHTGLSESLGPAHCFT